MFKISLDAHIKYLLWNSHRPSMPPPPPPPSPSHRQCVHRRWLLEVDFCVSPIRVVRSLHSFNGYLFVVRSLWWISSVLDELWLWHNSSVKSVTFVVQQATNNARPLCGFRSLSSRVCVCSYLSGSQEQQFTKRQMFINIYRKKNTENEWFHISMRSLKQQKRKREKQKQKLNILYWDADDESERDRTRVWCVRERWISQMCLCCSVCLSLVEIWRKMEKTKEHQMHTNN